MQIILNSQYQILRMSQTQVCALTSLVLCMGCIL
jgi:hypothetical protein